MMARTIESGKLARAADILSGGYIDPTKCTLCAQLESLQR